jgi:hypothetical protein
MKIIVDKACDTVEQEFQGDIGASGYNTSSDEQINAENQAMDVQVESIFVDRSEVKDTSTLSGQELPGQHANDNKGVNSVDRAIAANGDSSKDSDHSTDAENTTVDEPDCTLNSVEVNTVGKANDTNGHPSHESDVTVDAENSNIDGPDIIHDSSKTIDTNAEQTESMVDDYVEHNDVSQKNYQFNALLIVRESIQLIRQLM